MNLLLRNLLLATFFAVLTAVGAMFSISIPIPFYVVPFSMQTFVVLMSGLLLGPKYGPLSQALYIVMGLIGLPVFAGGAGGPQYVFSPTFGFLLGFVAASWVAGALAPRAKNFPHYALVCLAATVGLYVIALPCFYVLVRFVAGTGITLVRALQIAFLPFIIPDLIKVVAAGCLASRTIPMLKEAGLLPGGRAK
ncbi:MAG: biotin transporter BioY [Synergistaceae bacterium]|jgi:biotin transport system substrate-specific component|nr:biotin transporter BioY [Synergistaceae bacterium]